MKEKNNQEGSTYLIAILVIIVIAVIGFVCWKVWNNRTNNNPERLKARGYSLYLDGATDDNLINYYKIGLNIELENSYRNFDDDSLWSPPRPCPEISEDYAVSKLYEGKTLRIKVVDYKRIENTKGLRDADVECEHIDNSDEKSFDLDKAWLSQAGDKTVQIEGLDGKQFTLTNDGYKLTVKDDTKIVSQIPFYPDKVAVMIAWGSKCQATARDKIIQYAKLRGIPLADERYPGIEAIYRQPEREVNIVLDGLKDTDGRKYPAYLGGGDCSIQTTKPNLKSLDQTGLSYQ